MSQSNTPGSGNPGNFANDRERASEAGRKGGEQSQGGTSQSGSESGSGKGNPGNLANDREKASEAGRKGGEQSQGR